MPDFLTCLGQGGKHCYFSPEYYVLIKKFSKHWCYDLDLLCKWGPKTSDRQMSASCSYAYFSVLFKAAKCVYKVPLCAPFFCMKRFLSVLYNVLDTPKPLFPPTQAVSCLVTFTLGLAAEFSTYVNWASVVWAWDRTGLLVSFICLVIYF